ncbi:uncharacterized protein LOC120001871 [Tripterygium wilfordii]|uniref:uncharacterized protein LOC120001871 n=1 Tax=Tripterygium wilfordii TaxID=458696 RepID=UPI0018F841FD|nr:uncharacterized protein LOC120001871 [Tripterygium wilfordii]XP_038706303.1 uncharacterized protein LOC120001871 [Tripterygium wilfordii]XP_038706304.1 uncharacterized protein LOC120001871 [Tripterygium wilfordii]
MIMPVLVMRRGSICCTQGCMRCVKLSCVTIMLVVVMESLLQVFQQIMVPENLRIWKEYVSDLRIFHRRSRAGVQITTIICSKDLYSMESTRLLVILEILISDGGYCKGGWRF